jgi:hypothetical protein
MRAMRVVIACVVTVGVMSLVASGASAETLHRANVPGCSAGCTVNATSYALLLKAGGEELTCQWNMTTDVSGNGLTEVNTAQIEPGEPFCIDFVPENLPWTGKVCSNEKGEYFDLIEGLQFYMWVGEGTFGPSSVKAPLTGTPGEGSLSINGYDFDNAAVGGGVLDGNFTISPEITGEETANAC